MFNINFDILLKLLLPVSLRQPITEAWLKALLKPLKQLYNTFSTYRTKQLLALSYTGQTMYLKKLLNDNFDNARRFHIHDATDTRLYLCNDPDLTKRLTYEHDDADEVFFYNPEHDANYVDFNIHGPNDILLMPSHADVENYINRYKLAGKSYDITFLPIPIS